MLLGIELDEIIEFLGHDGSAIITNEPEPWCRRSFDIEEMAWFCYMNGWHLTVVSSEVHELLIPERPAMLLIQRPGRTPHAVAWDGNMVYDPDGTIHLFPDDAELVAFAIFDEIRT